MDKLREASRSLRHLISDAELMLSKNGAMTDEFKRVMSWDIKRAKDVLERVEAVRAALGQTSTAPGPAGKDVVDSPAVPTKGDPQK